VDTDAEILRRALKRLPAPEPRPGFIDRAFAAATRPQRSGERTLAQVSAQAQIAGGGRILPLSDL